MSTAANTYTRGERNGFLIGMFGQNMIYNIVATGTYFYFQNVIALPAMALGWIFALARVWDAINDPMMGTIVDRTKSRWGKCRPYLIFAPPIIMIITIATFLNSNYATAASQGARVGIVAWAAVSYVLWGMLYTIGDIPLWGITSLMTEDEEKRNSLLGLARIVAGFGAGATLIVQIAQFLGTTFESKGLTYAQAQQRGFIVTAIVMTVFSTILFECAGLFTKERVQHSDQHYTMKESFATAIKNKPFRQILISGILRSPVMLLMTGAMTLLTYYYCNGNIVNAFSNPSMLLNLALIGAGVFLGMFGGMALTPSLAKKYEKKTLYNTFSLVGAVPFALVFVMYLIGHGDIRSLGYSIVCFFLFAIGGGCWGGLNVLQSAMIADCIDYEEYTNGVRTDGVFFSGQSFITKLSSGIASLISAVVFAAVGYSGVNIDRMNTALNEGADFLTYADGKYAMAMFLLVSIPPAIGMVLAAIPTWHYALPDTEHKRILAELVARRAASADAASSTATATTAPAFASSGAAPDTTTSATNTTDIDDPYII